MAVIWHYVSSFFKKISIFLLTSSTTKATQNNIGVWACIVIGVICLTFNMKLILQKRNFTQSNSTDNVSPIGRITQVEPSSELRRVLPLLLALFKTEKRLAKSTGISKRRRDENIYSMATY